MESLDSSFHTLRNLNSITDEQIELLRKLGITNLGDLLSYHPFRYARFVQAASDQLLRKDEILNYLEGSIRNKDLSEILDSPSAALKDVGPKDAAVLKELGMMTITDLSRFAPYAEAEEIVTRSSGDDSDPFAPPCVLPTCKKFTRNSKSFVSFFKQKELRDLSIVAGREPLISTLFDFNSSPSGPPRVIYLGYSVSYLQEWIFRGVHLGEPQGSVNLFMGQDTQVSVLDWRRAIRASRLEDTRVTERLANTLFHQRAVDEVARATAEEHQHGATSTFGANAATAGSFVAAGALVGGVGGGISGALAGLVIGNAANVAGAAPTIGGAVAGAAVGSIAGAAAGSLIYSGSTTLGFVETDAEGNREVVGTSAQNIQQRTVQNSSSLRSFWSNIISQSVEDERQQIRTDRVTNHNRIHALNALYFEVLNEYQVNMRVNDFAPILFLPFKPICFTEAILRRYWWLIRTLLNDRPLVTALDEHFLTLSSDPSPATQLAELPNIEAIKTVKLQVWVNLSGSMMNDLLTVAVGTAMPTGGITALMAAFHVFFQASLRENIKVSIVTSGGEYDLVRQGSPNLNLNFVGEYATNVFIPVHSIEKIKITNENGEFDIPFVWQDKDGGWHAHVSLNTMAFEDIQAKITIHNKSSYTQSLPNIGSLEVKKTVRSTAFKIDGNRSETITWDIANKLRDQFEGITTQQQDLAAEAAESELFEAKIERLLGFLNANKYGFTRFILQNTEREQVINVLEAIQLGGRDLSSIANTAPLGFCGNHVVLLLKQCRADGTTDGLIGIDTSKLRMSLEQYEMHHGADAQTKIKYFINLRDNVLGQFLHGATLPGVPRTGSIRETKLLEFAAALKRLLDSRITGEERDQAFFPKIGQAIATILDVLNNESRINDKDLGNLCDYYTEVKNALAEKKGAIISSNEISLPSPAIFMEPVLSNAKGAELYDMRRNSHYEILPAPGIHAADPNVLRAQDITLTPNVPSATLTIQNAPELPLSQSLAAALGEAGKLDLGTLIQSNASSLTSMLSNLSTMATELAKASATLTGDAQKQALASATDVAKQVGDIVSKSLQIPSGETPAPPPAATPSPQTQQQKAEVDRRAREIDAGTGTPQQKKEQKKTIGAATTPDEKRNYRFSFTFRDPDHQLYTEDSFTYTLKVTSFELGERWDINGGSPIKISDDPLFRDTFTLTKGHKVKLSFIADINGVLVPGETYITLLESPSIAVICTMMSETQEIQASTAKEAVDTAVNTSSFGGNAGVLLDLFLNLGAKFPFKLAEATVGGSFKAVPDLKLAYNSSTTTTTGGTTTTTTTTTYKVTTPLNGWKVSVE